MKSIKELIEKINEIPLHEIVGTRVELRQRGREWVGICPNPDHDDHGLGSFSVNSNKGFIKCFACQKGYNNAITFISEVDRVSRYEAILRISLMAGFITEDEYKKRTKEAQSSPVEKIKITENFQRDAQGEIASADIRNLVYSIVTDGKKLEGGTDALTEEHREYLYNRGISDEEIEKYRYFSMPTRRAMRAINKRLSLFDSPKDILPGVPGFYFNKERGFFTLNPVKGIGLPIRNDEGQIVAIQVRCDNLTKDGQRYLWWSTSFAGDNFGASPGSPLDVVKPSVIKHDSLFITEGHFKAALLAKVFCSPVISVQGVGNWRNIKEEIGYLKAHIHHIFICYDADMAHNTAVMRQAIKMAGEIKKYYPDLNIFFVLWDEDLGKGIDDMILAGHIKKLHRKRLEEFASIWCTYKAQVDKLDSTDEEGRKNIFRKLFLEKK